jgi:alkylation response protein AidB-like acyl-CoA dehydrogenase
MSIPSFHIPSNFPILWAYQQELRIIAAAQAEEIPLAVGPDPSPSIEEFEQECLGFLEARYPRRPARRQGFNWGAGSDRVSLFQESTLDEVGMVRAWRRELFAAGLGWITGPRELGGRGLSRDFQRTFDRLAKEFQTPGNGALTISLGMIAPTILLHGTDTAKARYSRKLQSGDLIACQLFSEPGAGSDLAGVSTSAEPDGDGWRITGQKVWTSGAHYSDIGEILCRTAPGPRHRNLTAFIVEMSAPGIEVRPLKQMTGGQAFNEVFFEDVWVADENRLGEINGGWGVALTTLLNERGAIGDDGFGGYGLLDIQRYVSLLRAFDRVDDPVARDRLADLYANLQVAKWSRLRMAANRRKGQAPGPEASMGKLSLTQNYQRIAHLVSMILGPRLTADSGEWGTYAWAELVLGIPGFRLGGGTDEVMRNIVAERVLGLPREPA